MHRNRGVAALGPYPTLLHSSPSGTRKRPKRVVDKRNRPEIEVGRKMKAIKLFIIVSASIFCVPFAAFGNISSAFPARHIQVAVKFSF